MTVGRPRKYDSPEDMQEAIDAYFAGCKESGDIPLQSGLALCLGFASRQSLYDYSQIEKFSYILDEARLRCEDALSQMALKNKANSVIAKLHLAANYGYSDKQQIEHSSDPEAPISINIIGVKPGS